MANKKALLKLKTEVETKELLDSKAAKTKITADQKLKDAALAKKKLEFEAKR